MRSSMDDESIASVRWTCLPDSTRAISKTDHNLGQPKLG